MGEGGVTRAEMVEADAVTARLVAAEVLAAADARTEQRVTKAIEDVTVHLSMQVGMSERLISSKINGVKLWGALALLGGQAIAGLLAALVTGRVQPQDVGHAAAAALNLLA